MKRFSILGIAAAAAWLLVAGPALAAPPAGPPYPDQVISQRVYDYAGIFSSETAARAERIIAGIQERTGAQIAVYTQVKPQSDTLDKANQDALDLMNQWGVGRKGFDDGLVIMFDMQSDLRHGQVSLYSGSGYRAAFLSDSDRQQIFDQDMKPLLAAGDLNGGLVAGLLDIEANATADHSRALEQARLANALIFFVGPLLGLLLILAAFWRWLLHGRDPIYIDDNSILMPAPPAGLTPAMATLLLADRTSDRTVTAELVDLAARGAIVFKQEHLRHGENPVDAGIVNVPESAAEKDVLDERILDAVERHSKHFDNYISSSRMYHLIPAFDAFKSGLETASVAKGWLTEEPGHVTSRWYAIGAVEVLAAIVAGFIWLISMASGLFTLTLGLLVAGVATLFMAGKMPARTRVGAMLYAMLSAYKRTLSMTLTASGSMGEVVARRALPWVTTPDQAMVWAVAFGLDREVEMVLSRSMAAAATGVPHSATSTYWQPAWWTMSDHVGHSGHSLAGGASGSGGGGLFSPSAIPDPGAIMATLGSFASPSSPAGSGGSSGSSGSSFSSGSFGGGGGGGGGGAGGGF